MNKQQEKSSQQENTMGFQGFTIPEKNFYHMPNAFTNICAEINNLAELKIVLYILRHTWGYQEYGIYKAITTDEFMHGRKRIDGSRIDKGTGLSNKSIIDGLAKAVEHGFMEVKIDATDLARIQKSYAIKMQVPGSCVESTQHESSTRSYVDSTQLHEGFTQLRVESTQRSEKDTLERHLKKDTSRKKKQIAAIPATKTTTSAALNNFSLETITEEEIALLQAYRQNTLQVPLPLSENLWGGEAEQPSKQAERVIQADEQSGVEMVPAEVPVASFTSAGIIPSDEVPAATIGSDGPAPFVRPAAVETAEEVVQLWEYVRQVRYGERERVAQLGAATVLLGMELPQPRTPDLLETLYTTYYDKKWKELFGELHVAHLVGVEKSSGQVRIVRWINRLGIHSLPTPPSGKLSGTGGGEEPPKPRMDFANYPQEKRDPVQEYLDGTLDTSHYPAKMLEVLERHAAERRAVVAKGGNQ